jgi:peptidoglycan/LPS O-acetylase OafA/YrhL
MADGSSKHNGARGLESRPEFSANLDILRSVAVSLVLLSHVLHVIASRPHFEGLSGFINTSGRLGVLLFFVHTSLVLNFSLARIRASGLDLFRTFIVRRAFRLYPLSILSVLLVVAFHAPSSPLGETVGHFSWGTVLANITLTMDLAETPLVLQPLWTLPVELQMYVVMPVIFVLLGPARSPRVALGLWLVAAAVGWMQPDIAVRLPVLNFAPCFVAGTVAYTLSGLYTKRIAGLLWMPVLLALLYGFCGIERTVPYGANNMPLEWMFCLMLGLIIPLFHDSPLVWVNRVASWISRYSYGFYLFHCIALWVGCKVLSGLPEPVQWIVALGLLGVMSIGSYHLLEKPAIDLGARLTTPSLSLGGMARAGSGR